MKSYYDLKRELSETHSADRLELLQEQIKTVIKIDELKELKFDLADSDIYDAHNTIDFKIRWLVKYYYDVETKVVELSKKETYKELGI